WIWLVLFIALNTIINVLGIEFTARTNIVFLVGEILILLIFMAFGLWGITHGVGDGFTIKPIFDATHFNLNFV
ncbi:amino acid permease, partial [Streptococcus thermophilus]